MVAVWAVVINTVFGVGISLLLVRYEFPGKRVLSALLDVPLSVSPVVVGLALLLVYNSRDGWFGPAFDEATGRPIIFDSPGMIMATCFVALPLVIREVVPVLHEIGDDQEQAARSLGAGLPPSSARLRHQNTTHPLSTTAATAGSARLRGDHRTASHLRHPGMIMATCFVALPLVIREVVPVLHEIGDDQEQAARSLGAGLTTFRRITLPSIKWAVVYGVVLSLARSLGEFGAVKIVSGNITGRTQTATLVVEAKYQNFQQETAYATSFLLIFVSIACLIVVAFLRPKQTT